ncbi:uncharacterized protein SCHCODRAFT_02639875 [Schizophyllum commune H4-8]|uniref:uncharacterized protein n=1 Tax=Schizophyllum commune (strain H4-8 / FGSC 9210) TaxID=578458 RepID=UPI00215E73DB|nr:uncharacterized protein SCHCODRAFT_02639875 [Schizophyllum commune H4-8]KAI5886805.1 hypothetical protein SCHCODRAFT_02639875 [Schizophyllum commune H4-8]
MLIFEAVVHNVLLVAARLHIMLRRRCITDCGVISAQETAPYAPRALNSVDNSLGTKSA